MPSEWKPRKHSNDPMANAVLNVAEQIGALAAAVDGLLYGLKHGKDSGMSLAEAVEVAGRSVADAVGDVGHVVAEALEGLGERGMSDAAGEGSEP